MRKIQPFIILIQLFSTRPCYINYDYELVFHDDNKKQ